MVDRVKQDVYSAKRNYRLFPANDWNKDDILISLGKVKNKTATPYNITVYIPACTFWANTHYKVDACIRAVRRFAAEESEFINVATKISDTLVRKKTIPGNDVEIRLTYVVPSNSIPTAYSLTSIQGRLSQR